MNLNNKNSITKNIKRLLMFKTVNKIHGIIENEKKQKKSDKMHVLVIVSAATLAFVITLFVFSIFKI